MSHLTTIRTIYAAFGRGDIATILSHLDEHVDWDYGAGDTPVTWLKHRRGRDGDDGLAGRPRRRGRLDQLRWPTVGDEAGGTDHVVMSG